MTTAITRHTSYGLGSIGATETHSLEFDGHIYQGFTLKLKGGVEALIMPTSLSEAIIAKYFPDGDISRDVYPDTLVYYYATPAEMHDPQMLQAALEQDL